MRTPELQLQSLHSARDWYETTILRLEQDKGNLELEAERDLAMREIKRILKEDIKRCINIPIFIETGELVDLQEKAA